MNIDPEPEPKSIPTSPLLLASSLPKSSHATNVVPESDISLPPSCHVNVPEPECMPLTLPMSPILPLHVPTLLFLNSSMDLECLPSAAQSAMELQLPKFASLITSMSPDSPALPDLAYFTKYCTSHLTLQEKMSVSLHEVTLWEVKSAPHLQASAELIPSIHSEHSSEFPHLPLTINFPSSNHDPPSSPGKTTPVHPVPLFKASLTFPPHSSPLQTLSGFMQDDLLSGTLEDLLTIPIPICLTSLKWPPSLVLIKDNSDFTTLEVMLAPMTLAVPSILHQWVLEVMSTSSMPAILSFLLQQQLKVSLVDSTCKQLTVIPIDSVSSPFKINSVLVSSVLLSLKEQVPTFITTAVLLVSAFIIILSTISTHLCKSWSNNEDHSTNQNGTLNSGNSAMHQLVHQTFHPGCFKFTLESSHRDAHEHKLKTYGPMHCRLRQVHTCIPQHRLHHHVYQHLLQLSQYAIQTSQSHFPPLTSLLQPCMCSHFVITCGSIFLNLGLVYDFLVFSAETWNFFPSCSITN